MCGRYRRETCFAGLWDRCWTADASKVESFIAIVTWLAGAELNACHDRAPVLLRQSEWSTWLDLAADVCPPLGPQGADRFNAKWV